MTSKDYEKEGFHYNVKQGNLRRGAKEITTPEKKSKSLWGTPVGR